MSSQGAPPEQAADTALHHKARARTQAPFGRRLLKVAGVDELGAYRLLRLADPAGPAPQPGQFTMLAAATGWGAGEDERPFLPRAFSLARWQEGEAHYLMEDVGPGTRRLCELEAGEEVWALGPLGVGFTAPAEGRRAILVGGGVGIAPLAIWQDTLAVPNSLGRPNKANGSTLAMPNPLGEPNGADKSTLAVPNPSGKPNEADESPLLRAVLLGFRDAARAEGARLLSGAQVATDDGSIGHHGFVTDLLAMELDRDPQVTVYACGPAPMLEATRALCASRRVPAQLALESGMACGFGACFGCVVPIRDGSYVRVCLDGPVLHAERLERVEAHAGAPA